MQGSLLRRNSIPGSRLLAVAILVSLAAVLGLRAAGLASAAGLNFTVNDTSDRVDARIGDGVCASSVGTCTLRAAVQETNALPGADAIQVPAGTYALAIAPQGVNGSAVGDLDITDSLTIAGAGASSTIVDGGTPPSGAPPEVRGLDRLFEVAVDGGTVTLSGLTVSDGSAAEYGGAIMNSSSAAINIADSVIRGSTAGKTGGAVENHAGGTVRLLRSTLTQNYAVEGGSALNNNLNGLVELAESTVSANSAAVVGLDESLRGAGAIANNAEHDEVGTIVVADSEISDNRAGGGRSGAGIWNKGNGRITIDGTTFSKNRADADGGAIYSGPGEVTVTSSTFSENAGTNGGAISSGGSLTVLESVFTKNSADDWGGGVHNYNLGAVAIGATSFTENSALSGGGFANEGSGLVTVEGSTFSKNVAVVSAILDSGDGGGMHSSSGGEVVVTGVVFTENRARGGGGLSNGGGGVVRITGTRFSANTAEERGGGILVEGGDVRMVDIDVVGNISKSVGEGGGGIAFAGDKSAAIGESAAIERSRIRDNKTDGEGGGIDSRGDGPFAISMTSVTGNTAAIGGAVHHVGDAPLLVSRSTLARNFAEHGGGVFVDGDGEATVENSTVSGNRAGQFGGGVLVSSRVSVRSSTVVDNNAPSGGGLNNGGGPLVGDGFIFLANTIVANNPTGGNCAGTITSLGGNVENANTCQLVAAGDQAGTNPALGALADNGGPTQTHALLTGSPAQDAAVCSELEPCPDVDQRGVLRPLFVGHDVGAYESELPPGGDPEPPPAGECPKFPNSLVADRDSWISQGSATSNSGSDSSLKVKTQSGSNSRALVGFALPPLPEACTTIASAVLRLNAASAKEGRTLAVLQAAGPWSESGVTWNNQPPTAGPAATTPSGQGVLEWDVTAQLLGSYVSGNHGLVLRDAAENGPGDEQTFSSREKPADGPPELLLVFDDTTPETAIDSGPASPTAQAAATFAFSSDRPDATFECFLDGSVFAPCTSPRSTGALAEGSHRFEVRATRRVRAVDPTPAVHQWTIAIPPETSVAGPASPSSSPAATVTFSSDDPDATFECSANGAAFSDCTSPVEYTDLGDGEQEVRVRAVDPFGNADPTPAVHRWTVAVPPETAIAERPADPSNATSASFAFGGTDNGTAASELAFECRLDDAPFSACSSPATYEGLAEGAHSFQVRAIDLAGHVDPSPASAGWTIDVTPPQTAIDSGPSDPSNSRSAELAFSADEPARFECSLDGAPFAACSSPARYDELGEGRHSFAVKAIDPAGNADAGAALHEWTIDVTPPETTVDSGPRDPSNNGAAVLAFSAGEAATFACSLDGGPFAACSSPAVYEGLGEGAHSFQVRATDLAGNSDASPAAFGWRIDLTPPETSIDAGPADPSNAGSARFDFSADEAGVSFECRLDGGSFTACSSPQSYGGLAEGTHSFEVRAVDAAGNVEPAPALNEWAIDLTPPETAIDSGPADPSSSGTAELTFSAGEPSTFACSLDGGLFVACTSPVSFEALAEGRHELRVQATDAAGNSDPSPAAFGWTIDLTPPETTLDARPADPTRDTGATFAFSADEVAEFSCSLDGAPFAACSSPASYVGVAEGGHRFEVRATDRAGNIEPEPAVITWTVDLTAPESAIASGPADPSKEPTASFSFSAGEEAVFACSLDGAPLAACSSPASYTGLAEGSHRFEVRATDAAGNVEPQPAVFTWTIDLTAPETVIEAGPADPTAAAGASFDFSADESSSFECRLDGGSFAGCSSPHAYAELSEGSHVFDVRAVDRAGNVDPEPARFTWTIDLTPPETSIESRPSDPTTSSSAAFAFSAGEAARFECSLDGAPFAACSSPASYAGLAEGGHRFEVRAADAVGNVDATPATAVWTIDQTAPETAIEAGPRDPTNELSARISFSSDEPGSTFACSLDGAPFATCGSPAEYTGLEPGAHSFRVLATDRAGNSDDSSAVHEWTIDTTPPETAIDAGPADPTNSTTAGFAFSSGETGSSFECRLDGGSFDTCASPVLYSGLAEGPHTLDVRAVDRAGNVDPVPARYAWVIDATPPETTIDAGPADPTNSTAATFTFSAEAGATFACSLDGAPFASCFSPRAYAGLAEGAHELQVRAIDRAGNPDPSPAVHAWVVDVTPTETTIGAAPQSPTSSTSAGFAFSGGESGSTFECSLDGAAFAFCASPAEYADLAPGAHEFRVRATDPAGNVDPTPASHSWEIDRTPPETAIGSGPSDPTASSSASFAFSSDEPGSFACRLDGGVFVPCSSPQAYLGLEEGPHTFEVRAIDRAGNADSSPAAYGWRIDRTAPETTIDSGPGATTTSMSATFSFSSSEAGSAFECSLDGSAFAACVSPRELEGLSVGGHEFQVRALDAVANTDGTPAIYSWTVEPPPDTTLPETTIDSGPPALSPSASASFSFSSSKPGSSFACSLDGAAFAACASPRQYLGLGDGIHEFRVQATDASGNVDPTPAVHRWMIDTAAPETTIGTAPPALTSSTSASFSFSASEAGSTFECSLDGATFAACSSPRQYTGLAAGAHQFQVRARDAAGNPDGTPAIHSWTIDTAAPETTIDAAPPALTSSTSASFGFSASEANSTFECSLDGATFAVCGSPRQYTGLAGGAHQFRVRAVDAALNVDGTPATYAWTIDISPPQTTIGSGPAASTTSTTASFTFSSEPGATFECSLDTAQFAACSSPRQYTGLAVGSHQFRVRATDAAGNTDASPASHSWTISAPLPACSTPVTLAAVADAWIDENSPSASKGGDSILKVQSKGPRDNFRALLRFPVPTVPQGCVIDTATLRLYAASMKPDRVLQALRLGAAWVENTANWSNQPPTTGVAATATSGFGYREWNVTSHVQAMLAAGASHGFLVRDAAEGADAEQQFHSREKGESPPQLVLRFASGG